MEVKLVVANGKQAGKEIPVKPPKFVIGRNEDCQLRPQSHLVSRYHCAILVGENSAAIEDLGSTNGTFVNGEKLAGRHELKTGDRIKVGLLEVDVHLPAAVGAKPNLNAQAVQKLPVRAAPSSAAGEDDLDISRWFTDDDDALNVPPPEKKPSIGDDTHAGKSLTDTSAMPVPAMPVPTSTTVHATKKEEEKKKEKEAHGKSSAKLIRPKPTTNSSGDAAEDALRNFFHRKKS
jgi:pSer/pThr/pTyr-binding forkhead associated (FHA) protein